MRRSLFAYVFALTFITRLVRASGPYESLGDIFDSQLANLTRQLELNPYLGGQSFFQCCLIAVNESLQIVDGNIEFTPGQTHLHGDIATFMRYQFPCTASYNGSEGDQPQVTISYSWCHNNCPGWAKTQTQPTSDWIQPLVAFILPTIVFSFSIPRRRTIVVPRCLFPYNGVLQFPKNLTLVYKVPITVILLLMDALMWVATSIVMAAPMLWSGAFEALLDAKVISYLRSHYNNRAMSLEDRAHLLLIVLIGNLDQEPSWDDSKKAVLIRPRKSGAKETSKESTVTQVAEKLRIMENDSASSQESNDGQGRNSVSSPSTLLHVSTIKTKLAALLKSQTSFATSVGIGVIFYTSSFFYTILEIRSAYGDGATSHSLAFGIFWMTIGHVAVVAAVLLASNNPSAWEGIASENRDDSSSVTFTGQRNSTMAGLRHWVKSSIHQRKLVLPAKFKHSIYRSPFSDRYKTASMWNRGKTKALWIARFLEEHPEQADLQREILRMGWRGWLFATTIPTVLLYFIPSFLGGMASYTNPVVGVSCRSMIPIVYSSAQTLLVICWLTDWLFWCRTRDGKIISWEDLRAQQQKITPAGILWYLVFLIGIFGAIFSAIGGTIFHLMGLFQNCLCYILARDWHRRRDPTVTMYLGSNSSEQIYYAKHFWLPIGIAATVFLIVTTYLGWRYQRNLQIQFLDLVEGLDDLGNHSKNITVQQPVNTPPTANRLEQPVTTKGDSQPVSQTNNDPLGCTVSLGQ